MPFITTRLRNRTLLFLGILSPFLCLSVPAQEKSQDKQEFKIPFRLEGKFVHIAVDATINGKSSKTIVDTGLEKDIMLVKEAGRLGIDRKSSKASLKVGDLTIEDNPWYIYDAPGLVYANRDDGFATILGYPFLSRFAVTFDFKKKELRLAKPGSAAVEPPKDAVTVPFEFSVNPQTKQISGGIIVEVKLNGKGPFRGLIDTGSPRLRVTPDLMRKVGGTNTLQTLEVGSITLKNLEVSSQAELAALMQQHKIDMLIGLKFQSRYIMTVDYQNKKLILVEHGDGPVVK